MVYSGKRLKEISFPLGGIGTGSIGLSGNGALLNWEIFNRPNKGSDNDYCHFAVKAEYPDGRVVTKALMGDTTYNLTGNFENGKMQFRSKLPLERGRGNFHPCLDGQMANLVKIYSDWKISGNTEWLKENRGNIKRAFGYCKKA